MCQSVESPNQASPPEAFESESSRPGRCPHVPPTADDTLDLSTLVDAGGYDGVDGDEIRGGDLYDVR